MNNPDHIENLPLDEAANHKIAQAVYHTVTGKTEKLQKSFSENYCVKFADLEQLNAKFEQMSTQWSVLGRNTNITVQHLDDNKQNFSSIERMRVYDQSQTSPVEAVSFEYNLLLQMQGVEKPQPYKVTIRVMSSIAMMRRFQRDMPPSSIFRFFNAGPVVAEIEYVDYVVARTMMGTIESWVSEVQTSSSATFLRWAQRHSYWVPQFSKATLFVIASLSAFFAADSYLLPESNSLLLAEYLLVSCTFIASSMFVGFWLGRAAEGSIDRLQELSYIELNRGDEKLREEFFSKNRKSKIGTFAYLALITAHAISCGLIASYVFDKFFT